MNVKRLASTNVWQGFALVLVCFIALATLALGPSAVEAGNGHMQPPPPPPPGGEGGKDEGTVEGEFREV